MVALITEACRIKDRLDKLNALLSGDIDRWSTLVELFEGSAELVLQINGAAVEARQSATVFRQMLAEVARRRKEGDQEHDDDPLADL